MIVSHQKSPKKTVIAYKKHSLAIRWTHWINFPLLSLMIISGFMIYWANRIYTPFIPDSWYSQLGLSQQLSLGMGIHFFFMWFFALNGLVYVVYLIVSGEWRQIVPSINSFKDAVLVMAHDLGIRKSLPSQTKFNGAQKIAYSSVTLIGLVQVLTGLSIYKPVQFQTLMAFFGGYEGARLVHFIMTMALCLFFFIHIFQVLRTGWNNFRAMVTGYEEITNSDVQKSQGIEK